MTKTKIDNKKTTNNTSKTEVANSKTTTTTTSSLNNAKIAIVDVQALVNQTPSVIALRAEQQNNAAIIVCR